MSDKVRSIVVEGRVDARSLATIANSLTSRGILIRSRSHLVSTIIDAYSDLLVDAGLTSSVVSTENALEILSGLNINFKTTVRKNLKVLSSQISSERALEALTSEIHPTSQTVVPQSLLNQAEQELDNADEEN